MDLICLDPFFAPSLSSATNIPHSFNANQVILQPFRTSSIPLERVHTESLHGRLPFHLSTEHGHSSQHLSSF